MTTAQDETAIGQKVKDTLASPSVQKHMLIVGFALFMAGGLTLWPLPDISLWWVLAAVVIVAHIGLLMVIVAAILKWLTGSRRPTP